MLVKSQHLESKGKKVKSSRSSLAITGSSRSAWSTPCFKTGSNLSNKETLQGLNHPEHSAPLLTHRDRSGSCVLLAGGGRAAVLFLLKDCPGAEGLDLLSSMAFGAVRTFVILGRSTILLLL